MFRNLGRTLAPYYFQEDCRAVPELVEASGSTEERTFRETLGVGANELCELAIVRHAGGSEVAMAAFIARYAECLTITDRGVCKLLGATLDKFRAFAPVLGVDPARSRFVSAMAAWLAGEPEPAVAAFEPDTETEEVRELTSGCPVLPVPPAAPEPSTMTTKSTGKTTGLRLGRLFSAFRRVETDR